MLYDYLVEHLNPQGGKFLPKKRDEELLRGNILTIIWPNNISFQLNQGYGNFWGHVSKGHEQIGNSYVYSSQKEKLVESLQHMINDIAQGKYHNKKTRRELCYELIKERQLTSFMNNTKWTEFFDAIAPLQKDLWIRYKTLFDEKMFEEFWTLNADEMFPGVLKVSIESFEILVKYIKKDKQPRGQLQDPIVTEIAVDREAEIKEILEKFNIPYEIKDLDEARRVYRIYGYK